MPRGNRRSAADIGPDDDDQHCSKRHRNTSSRMAEHKLQEPAFINYLLDPDLDHDCYFLVGREDLGTTEKIGAVKKMLLAHSVVLRSELQDSKMAEKGVVPIKDLYPDTFRNLLRYVYGYDNMASLSFDDLDNLLYAAEKYLMTALKNKLATLLMGLLSYENICTLMNNPACYRHLELDSAITKILQFETDRVLASPQFLSLSPDAFLKILEQDVMKVPEVEVWRAALKWAKNRTGSEDGEVLRKELTPHVKHIRLCTLSGDDLCKEVIWTRVLSDSEFAQVCTAVGRKEEQAALTEICNTLQCRAQPRPDMEPGILEADLGFKSRGRCASMSFTLLTKTCGLELLPFVFTANDGPAGETYQSDCTVHIIRLTDYVNNTSTELPVTVMFTETVECYKSFLVPITDNRRRVRLLPNNTYHIKVTFTEAHTMHYVERLGRNLPSYENDHFRMCFTQLADTHYRSPISTFKYKIVSA